MVDTRLKKALARLEDLVKSPDSDEWKAAADLIRDIGRRCADAENASLEDLPLVSRAAFDILAIAETTSNPSLLSAGISALIRSGRFGRLLLCRYIRKELFPLDKLQAVVNSLPPDERFLLLHELCRRPQINSPALTKWAAQILSALGTPDPAEGLMVLATLGREGDVPSFPVHDTLTRGGIDEFILQNLESDPQDEALEDLVQAAATLGHERTLAGTADHIKDKTPSGAPALFSLLSRNAVVGDEPLAKASFAMLKKTRGAQSLLCVDTFMALEWAKTGAMMALFFKKRPSMQRALGYRAMLLPSPLYRNFMDALSDKERIFATACAFDAVARFEPGFIEESLRRERARKAADKLSDTTATRIAQYIKKRREQGLFGDRPTEVPEPPAPPSESAAGKIADTGDTLESKNISGAVFQKKKSPVVLVRDCSLKKAQAGGIRFTKASFRDTDLSKAVLTRCVFKRCTFKNVDFTKAYLAGCRFEVCSFENCRFTQAALLQDMLLQCSFENCRFCRSLMHETGISFTEMELCGFAGSTIQFTQIRSSRFNTVDFSGALFHTANLQGVEFQDCLLNRSAFRKTAFQECSQLDCTTPGATLREIEGGPPEILRACADSAVMGIRIMQSEKNGESSLPAVLAKAGADFVRRTVERWVLQRDMARCERRMLINNEHRLDLAKGQFPPAKRPFFKMLPYLLHTDLFEQFKGIEGVPGCELDGYVPDYGTVALAKKFFPGLRPGPAGKSPIKIKAVYTIGSIGSMAQTPDSDIDCWVCCEWAGKSEQELTAFKKKLETLTEWAMEEFGLEAYFFAMDMKDVRANNFGLTDAESSGSAQALLLKEEFYRTAVRITGRNLLWWAVPPGINRAEYKMYAKEARTYPLTGTPRLEDLGHLASVPGREFFGASLWQLVKGIKSPYKSVMKLGLLGKYAGGGKKSDYLCEQIKSNIHTRRNDIKDSDPYILLFRTLVDHYHNRGDESTVELIRESFRLKAAVDDIDGLAFNHDASGGKTLPGQFGARSFSSKGKSGPAAKTRPFPRMLELGDMVNVFMLDAYKEISTALDAEGASEVNITPEDLTKLGRTVIAAYARKPDKVHRNPFLDVSSVGQTELRFGADKAPGRKPIWWVKGRRIVDKISRDAMDPMIKGADPAMLMAWLTANSIFSPESVMDADRTITPLVLEDVSMILKKMSELFPVKKTFFPDAAEALKPERVINVLMVPNLTIKRDQKKISTLSIIYNTNWGELFCHTEFDPGPAFQKRPSAYLKQLLPMDTGAVKEMHWLPPKRCVCPRVSMI